HRQAADDHEHEPRQNSALVAEPLADGAVRQAERNARCQVEADQQANVGELDAQVAAEQGRDGRNALELEGHGRPNGEQDGEYAPPTRIDHLPRPLSAREKERMLTERGAAHKRIDARLADARTENERVVVVSTPGNLR